MYLLDLQILHKTCVLLENKQHGWPDCLFMQKFATWNYRIRVVTVALRTHIVCGGLSRTPSCHLEQHQALWQSTRRAWAIIRLPKLPIKPHIVCHCACDQIIQALSPFFGQYATKSWGGALEWGYYIYIQLQAFPRFWKRNFDFQRFPNYTLTQLFHVLIFMNLKDKCILHNNPTFWLSASSSSGYIFPT